MTRLSVKVLIGTSMFLCVALTFVIAVLIFIVLGDIPCL